MGIQRLPYRSPKRHPATAASRRELPLPGGRGMEDTIEADYARIAASLLAQREWVQYEAERLQREQRAQARLIRTHHNVAAGKGFPGSQPRDYTTGLPEPGTAGRSYRPPPGGTPGGSLPPLSPIWAEIGPAPVCGPDDRTAAAVFARKVATALERGGWDGTDRSALHHLWRTWGARARGEDIRFRVAGNVRGRLPAAVERHIRSLQAAEPKRKPATGVARTAARYRHRRRRARQKGETT